MSVSAWFVELRSGKPSGRRTPIQSRKDLRPGDWHLIWPELAANEGETL